MAIGLDSPSVDINTENLEGTLSNRTNIFLSFVLQSIIQTYHKKFIKTIELSFLTGDMSLFARVAGRFKRIFGAYHELILCDNEEEINALIPSHSSSQDK